MPGTVPGSEGPTVVNDIETVFFLVERPDQIRDVYNKAKYNYKNFKTIPKRDTCYKTIKQCNMTESY